MSGKFFIECVSQKIIKKIKTELNAYQNAIHLEYPFFNRKKDLKKKIFESSEKKSKLAPYWSLFFWKVALNTKTTDIKKPAQILADHGLFNTKIFDALHIGKKF